MASAASLLPSRHPAKLGLKLAVTAAVLLAVLVPLSEPITVVPIGRRAYMLSDAALDPLYSSDPEPITIYKWVGANAGGYDAEAQNAWGGLPMTRAEITDPDEEFRGTAPKDLSLSCAAKGTCEEEFNAWAFLIQAEEAKTLKKRNPQPPPDEAWDAWSNLPLNF